MPLLFKLINNIISYFFKAAQDGWFSVIELGDVKPEAGLKNVAFLTDTQIENYILELFYHLAPCDIAQVAPIFGAVGVFCDQRFKKSAFFQFILGFFYQVLCSGFFSLAIYMFYYMGYSDLLSGFELLFVFLVEFQDGIFARLRQILAEPLQHPFDFHMQFNVFFNFFFIVGSEFVVELLAAATILFNFVKSRFNFRLWYLLGVFFRLLID